MTRRPTAPRQTSRSSTARPCRTVFVIIAALAIVVTAPWRALREAEARTVVQGEPSPQIYCVFRARGRRYGFVLLPFLRSLSTGVFFSKQDELRKLAWSGIPDDLRPLAWPLLLVRHDLRPAYTSSYSPKGLSTPSHAPALAYSRTQARRIPVAC